MHECYSAILMFFYFFLHLWAKPSCYLKMKLKWFVEWSKMTDIKVDSGLVYWKIYILLRRMYDRWLLTKRTREGKVWQRKDGYREKGRQKEEVNWIFTFNTLVWWFQDSNCKSDWEKKFIKIGKNSWLLALHFKALTIWTYQELQRQAGVRCLMKRHFALEV